MTKDPSWFSDEVATFGDRLATAREESGLTQQALATRLGVRLTTLKAWENDLHEPRGNRLQMLAGMLGVSLGWLMTGVGVGPQEPVDPPDQSRSVIDLTADLGALRALIEQSGAKLGQIEKRLAEARRKTA